MSSEAASKPAGRRQLRSDRSGAMFLMGIPICFFMIGLLYFVIGIGEEIVLRERMQDAADAAALSAAVVHARGMNLIALLNQIMAALVGLLIMVKLLESVLIAAIALATALSWPTAGASLSVIPPAEVGREEAANAYDALKEVVEPLVTVIHYLEVGVQYGMPVVAELRSVEIASSYNPVVKIGVVIPGDFPLPLKNGTWDRLCKKGGEAAGELILAPLNLLLPVDEVKNAVTSVIGGLAETFKDYFCGGGQGLTFPTSFPPVELKEEEPIDKNLPPLASSVKCTTPQASSAVNLTIGPDGLPVASNAGANRALENEGRIDQRDQDCEKAAREVGMATPDDNGNPTTTCTYRWPNQQRNVCDPCLQPDGSACPQFMEKVSQAAAACRPGTSPKPVKYNYQRSDFTWQAELTPVGNCDDPDTCRYSVTFRESAPQHTESKAATGEAPCGAKGLIGPEYNTAATYKPDQKYGPGDYLCVQPHAEPDPDAFTSKPAGYTMDELRSAFKLGASDSGWTQTGGGDTITLQGQWSAVTFIHSCDQRIEKLNDSQEFAEQTQAANARQPPGGLGQKQGATGCGDESQDQVHLDMEPANDDNVLGGSIYQMRSIVLRNDEKSNARGVVEAVPLRLRGSRDAATDNPLGEAGAALRKMFAAQAEYYFDTTYQKDGDGLDHTAIDREEWTWIMAWKARMRRLRFGLGEGTSTCGDGWSTQVSRQEKKPQQQSAGGGGGQTSCDMKTASTAQGGEDLTPDALISKLDLADSDDLRAKFGQGGQAPAAPNTAASSNTCGSIDSMSAAESLVIH